MLRRLQSIVFLMGMWATAYAKEASTDAGGYCTMQWDPVCGSNLRTYGNMCEFNKAQSGMQTLTVLYKGECGSNTKVLEADTKDCDNIMCTMEYAPVCGSDLVTYSNNCMFGAAKCHTLDLYILHDGECEGAGKVLEKSEDPCVRQCTEEYRPMCGTNGVTYDNPCYYANALCNDGALSIASMGECPTKKRTLKEQEDDSCKVACTEEWHPVCGSDHVTYDNACYYRNAHCRDNTLSIMSVGECSDDVLSKPHDPCRRQCTEEYQPVCGSDQVTYDNACYFNNAHCKDGTLALMTVGECPTESTRHETL